MRNFIGLIATLCVGLMFGSCGDEARVTNAVDSGRDDIQVDVQVMDIRGDTMRLDAIPSQDLVGITGDFGQSCAEADDCNSGYCVQSADGTVCTKTCDSECPEGWSCKQVLNRSDAVFICLPNFPTICTPCKDNSECNLPGSSSGARCLPIENEGAFCAGDCSEVPCPSGYTCRDAEDLDGNTSSQCVKDDMKCECTVYASGQNAKTHCPITNDFGTCVGERGCSASGTVGAQSSLSDCEGPTPALEICDGEDNDCSATTLDGASDPELGGDCDGDDSDLCLEGVYECVGGALVCSDTTDGAAELCDSVDNDCDPSTEDGISEAEYGTACDGDDEDLCLSGAMGCVDGTMKCIEDGGSIAEVCDGTDNDCNPDTADGSQDPKVGTACDGDDADLCAEGLWTCDGGTLLCAETSEPKVELCDGIDNDCDPSTPDGADEQSLGSICDGEDDDLCEGGFIVCVAGELTCDDSIDSVADTCDGEDNDCNPDTPDGSGDMGVDVFCDGDDIDACEDGKTVCTAGAIVCIDPADPLVDLCDGADNDCDPSTEDGSGDPLVGVACDGDDNDLCTEGTTSCVDGQVVCSDPNTEELELCDGVDNDCDPTTPDGAAEPTLGEECDGDDADLCVEGKQACIDGVLGCDDPNDEDPELCDQLDNDCDGEVDEDFPNSDGTGLPDCLDDDDDDDGVTDDLDCAPTDPNVFPNCDGKVCGDDGCGGSCGSCGGQEACVSGACVCQPDCNGKTCGGDGCGGSCGSCGGGQLCDGSNCYTPCQPNCNGKECGSDGCGGSCGGCPGGQLCDGSSCYTPCQPNCNGKVCGGNGCGGSCGSCGANETCEGGQCEPVCVPNCNGKVCGGNGCGGSCGSCGANETCEGGQCEPICVPNCTNKSCGDDGCGGSCGSCGPGQICGPFATCIAECTPQCGIFPKANCGPDGCGGVCGTCDANSVCKPNAQGVNMCHCTIDNCGPVFDVVANKWVTPKVGESVCISPTAFATCWQIFPEQCPSMSGGFECILPPSCDKPGPSTGGLCGDFNFP